MSPEKLIQLLAKRLGGRLDLPKVSKPPLGVGVDVIPMPTLLAGLSERYSRFLRDEDGPEPLLAVGRCLLAEGTVRSVLASTQRMIGAPDRRGWYELGPDAWLPMWDDDLGVERERVDLDQMDLETYTCEMEDYRREREARERNEVMLWVDSRLRTHDAEGRPIDHGVVYAVHDDVKDLTDKKMSEAFEAVMERSRDEAAMQAVVGRARLPENKEVLKAAAMVRLRREEVTPARVRQELGDCASELIEAVGPKEFERLVRRIRET